MGVCMWRKNNEPPSMWVHHILGIYGCLLTSGFRQATWFPAVFLITEITVAPSNLLWWLRSFGVSKKSAWVKLAEFLRFVTHVFVRFPCAFVSVWYAYNFVKPTSALS